MLHWFSLNFIRLLPVVITPLLRWDNDSKQSDEFQASIDSPFENLFSSLVLLVKAQFSCVWHKDLNEFYVNLLKFFTFLSLKPKQFGGIAHVSGFKLPC